MNPSRRVSALFAIAATGAIVLSGCSSESAESGTPSSSASSTPVDSGVLGVQLPPGAEAKGQGTAELAIFALPGQSFDEATTWIDQHRPAEKVGAMTFHDKDYNATTGTQQWCWQSATEPYEVLVISVASSQNPIEAMVQHGKDDPVGC